MFDLTCKNGYNFVVGVIMIKPKRLNKGDKIAIVSPSSGLLGEKWAIHKLDIAKKRLEEDFGLEVVVMPNALKGADYLYKHPEVRAKDLMDAFKDKSIKAIICAIGGCESIRLLPYIDFDVIKNNPKIFMGYSDITILHFMMRKAGINSFYGPAILTDFSEYVSMFPYTQEAVKKMLFSGKAGLEIKPAMQECNEFLPWGIDNINIQRKLVPCGGYELIQGEQKTVQGELIGGCIDTFVNMLATEIWPSVEEFRGKVLCLETSDEKMKTEELAAVLRGLAAQGVFDRINAVLVGKPQFGVYYEEYKEVYKKVIGQEYNRPDLPIIYNVNFGHGYPIGVIPFGVNVEVDSKNLTIKLKEDAFVD